MDQIQFSEQYSNIVETYEELGSISAVVEKLHVSEVKVRRVLITEGLWSSRSSRQIAELMEEGLSATEIADKLSLTVKAVEAYMPYRRGLYDPEHQSPSAVRSDEYRKRNAAVARKQVHSENSLFPAIDHIKMEEINMTTVKQLYEKHMEKPPQIMKLRLTLSEEWLDDRNVLERYGKSKRGIMREILVPANITLHALHYVIQRAFGWRNSHLHHFEYTEDVFHKLLGSFGNEKEPLYTDWEKLCGVYFQFPSEEFDDIYWDDDYSGYESVKSWFQKKYTAPYFYGGFSEHYLECWDNLLREREENPVVRVFPSFEEYTAAKLEGREPEHRMVPIDKISFEDMNRVNNYGMEELLERNTLIDLIFPRNVAPAKNWKEQIAKITASQKITADVRDRLHQLRESIEEAAELYADGNYNGLIQYDWNMSEYKELVEHYDPKPVPMSNSLIYKYDYGDSWEVTINCEEVFYTKIGEDEDGYTVVPVTKEDVFYVTEAYNSDNIPVDAETRDQIARMVTLNRPVCIAADGLPVLDDVGGINGYCSFLSELHEGDVEDRRETREWARGQGWTGRMQKPENIL